MPSPLPSTPKRQASLQPSLPLPVEQDRSLAAGYPLTLYLTPSAGQRTARRCFRPLTRRRHDASHLTRL